MKIMFLLHSSGSSEGSSIAVLSLIRQLRNKGYQVHVVCPKQGPLIESFYEIGVGVSIIRYASAIYPKVFTFKSFLSWPKRMLDLLWYNHIAEIKLQKLVEKIHPDVIHTNVGVLRVGYYVAKRMHIPHVWHVRETAIGINSKHYPTCRYQKKLLSKNSCNIAITQKVFEYYDLAEQSSHIVYDGVFSESFINKDRINKKNYFLFVGRISESKGADWAVESFFRIADQNPNIDLLLAGSDNSPYAQELKNKVRNTTWSKRVKFIGPRHDIYELMSDAQAVLVSSMFEGFGFITVESMVNRTIVIGRNTGGTKEQFDNGLKMSGHEIALRCDTIEDMALHMADVLRFGQDYYRDMIDSAYDVVRKLYTNESNANQIEQIYKKIAK